MGEREPIHQQPEQQPRGYNQTGSNPDGTRREIEFGYKEETYSIEVAIPEIVKEIREVNEKLNPEQRESEKIFPISPDVITNPDSVIEHVKTLLDQDPESVAPYLQRIEIEDEESDLPPGQA